MVGGIYFGEESCKTNCVLGYVCDQKTWKCNVKPSGTYKTKDDCTKVCKEPEPKYSCNTSTWKCEVKSSGESLKDCNKQCISKDQPTPKYSCNKDTGKCVIDATGKYLDERLCNAGCIKVVAPPPLTLYSCNLATKTCSVNSTGIYSNLASCNQDCKSGRETPIRSCWITDFSIKPLVLGSLSVKSGLKWFTTDWYTTGDCQSCDLSFARLDVKGNPTSEFTTVKTGLSPIGSYDIKDNTKVGSYKYMLTCFGATDTPTSTFNVKILPFMIWYEVNPVFPSRFKKIESMPGT